MAVKLHRCRNIWIKGPHPCWTVHKALDEQGIEYEIGVEPGWGKRENVVRLTGERKLPVIEFEDGSVYREESKDMARTIRDGKLREKQAGGAGSAVQ